MNWLDFVDWQPSYNALKFLGIFLVTGLGIGYILGKSYENKKTIYKTASIILVIIIAFTGYNWITTPHLSSGIKLDCDIPETPEKLAQLVLIKEAYDGGEAYLFTKRFAGFSWHSGGASSTYKHELYSGLYNLTFYGSGMSHFEFNMPSKERYKTEYLTEAQCIEKADQLIILPRRGSYTCEIKQPCP